MDDSFEQYPQWAAPAEDGGVLVWPAPPQLLADARRNNLSLRSATAAIQSVPLSDVRWVMRRCLNHPADDQLFLATGHQAELYHPGVWAKDVVIDLAAKAAGGMAYLIAVDTDEPKHLHLRWPGESHLISDDPALRSARWSGLVKPPSTAHVEFLRARLAAARSRWGFDPMLGQFLDALDPKTPPVPVLLSDRPEKKTSCVPVSIDGETSCVPVTVSLAQAVTDACHAIDESLGLTTRAVMAGPVWCCPAYLLFAHHILSRAGEFATTYNAALAEFRRTNGIKNPGRPMPDLKVAADEIEVPFWIDDLADGGRRRGSVRRTPDGLALEGKDGALFHLDPALDGWAAAQRLADFLRQHSLRLSPRALTLTMCLRLLAVDQFVHGIGGGRYDQVTDLIIERHFGLPRPHFAVATATLLFPEAAGRQRICLRCIRQEGHRLRHAILGDAKKQLVRRIESAPRNSQQRRELFADLHRRLRDAQDDPRLQQWRQSYAAAQEQAARDSQIFDREFLYPLQPRERLQMLIGVYAEAFEKA